MGRWWKDPRLSFSTAGEKTKEIQFPDDSWKQIWVPDTFIRDARNVKVDDDLPSNRLLRVKSDGEVWYAMRQVQPPFNTINPIKASSTVISAKPHHV